MIRDSVVGGLKVRGPTRAEGKGVVRRNNVARNRQKALVTVLKASKEKEMNFHSRNETVIEKTEEEFRLRSDFADFTR